MSKSVWIVPHSAALSGELLKCHHITSELFSWLLNGSTAPRRRRKWDWGPAAEILEVRQVLSGLPFEGAANSMLDSAEQDFTAEIPMITQSLTDAGNAARGEFGRLAGQLPAEAAATKTTFDNRVIDTNANLATAISGNTQAGAIAAAIEFGDIRSEAGPNGGTGYWSATPGENLGIFVSPDGSYWSGYYRPGL